MNSDKKLYEELLKYHPEFKDSKQDIQKAITHLQNINPQIRVDQKFWDDLKNQLMAVADYQSNKKTKSYWLLKFFVPVFSLWFAIFGFWYLHEDALSPKIDDQVHQEIESFGAPAMMQMRMWDLPEDNIKMYSQPLWDDMDSQAWDDSVEVFMLENFSEDISDTFAFWCSDLQWEVSTLNDDTRVCTSNSFTCLESDYKQGNCPIE